MNRINFGDLAGAVELHDQTLSGVRCVSKVGSRPLTVDKLNQTTVYPVQEVNGNAQSRLASMDSNADLGIKILGTDDASR